SDLANRAMLQAQKFGATLNAPAEVARLSCESGYHLLRLEGGEEIASRCVLISTGASYRKLDNIGDGRWEGSGLDYCAASGQAQSWAGCPVVVAAGGNSAGQASVFLSQSAEKVMQLSRGGGLGKKMAPYLSQCIEQSPNIEGCPSTEISRLHGGDCLAA